MTFLQLQHLPDEALRGEIIRTALEMNALRINQGTSGNVSARVSALTGHEGTRSKLALTREASRTIAPPSTPEGPGATAFLITPTGIPYADTQPAQIVTMHADGSHDGDILPSSEWRFHRDIYAARRDVNAIVHTHAPFATTLACLDRGIPPFHYMVAIAGGKDIRCAPYATFGTQALSDHAVAALRDRNACLLSHHGMIACGTDLEQALALAVEVESLARMYWQALQIGEPVLLPDAEMATVLEKFATYGQQPA